MPSIRRLFVLLPILLTCVWGGLAVGGAVAAETKTAAEPKETAEMQAADAVPAVSDADLASFRPERRDAERAYEAALRASVDPARLRAWHDLTSSRPHVAGSAGDAAVIAALARELRAMGLEVEVQDLWLYLAKPVAAELAVVAPERVDLPLREEVLPEDPYSADPTLDFGWNAYSGSGEVTAGVVYANHGTKEDFARLAELGVDVAGKIVIARYGGNFRGYKAKFAEQAGAAGLVMYLDPEDYGYVRGLMWPQGGWANGSTIQRGALLTIPYPGDPLTPFVPATAPPGPDGELPRGEGRLAPSQVDLPAIPVQPVGWAAAREILSRMRGDVVPAEWQGGLPFNYRLTGGPELRVHLKVEQQRGLTHTANVVATLRGTTHPDEKVIVGCHHDAWSFGAGDPNSGSIVVLEAARAFAEAARRGHRPARSLVFANWAAEEFGIEGSVEWVEAHEAELEDGAVAYLNLDMASMGPRFGASATPSLAPLVIAATRAVESPVPDAGSVYDEWRARGGGGEGGDDGEGGTGGEPRVGALGGGSDHVGFYAHLGVPAASLGGGGSQGVSYHTAYEDLAWYRAIVGDDYRPAQMVTRVVVTLLARLAEADLLPLEPAGYGAGAAERVRAVAAGLPAEPASVTAGLAALATDAAASGDLLAAARSALQDRLEAGELSPADLETANRELRAADHAWSSSAGLSGRPWYRNLYAAPDADSGYAPWMLPELTRAAEAADPGEIGRADGRYREVVRHLDRIAGALAAAAGGDDDDLDLTVGQTTAKEE